MNSKTLN